jgi:hypothetical protein
LKDLNAAVITQIDATGKRPVLLFELGLSSTLRYAANISNITFPTAGNTYTAKAIKINNLSQGVETQINRVVVSFDNVSRDMAEYAYNQDFRGKTLKIYRVYLDALGNAAYYNELFNGYMERPSRINQFWLTVPATSGQPLNRKAISFYYQKLCPWIFGGDECNTNVNADLTSLTAAGTADSGTTTTLVDNALTQATEYWNHGSITLVQDGVTYYRNVAEFDAANDTITFDVQLPVSVNNTCAYTVYKGCDKTWSTCQSLENYGPSADNKLNFGGCLHIAVKPDKLTKGGIF